MNRPAIRKILMIDGASESLVARVREIVPEIRVVQVSTQEEVTAEIIDAQIVIGGKLTDEQILSAQELQWHHVPWVGVEHIVTSPIYAERGIILTNGSGTNAANIAEHVIAMMLAFARDLPRFVRDQDQHAWRHWDDHGPNFFDLAGQTVVSLGTGDIARATAKRLSAFGCHVIGASRSGHDIEEFDSTIPFYALPDLLATANHVVNCLPMTPDTSGIVDAKMLNAMKPGTYFFNVGRGGTVDQEALIEALQSGHLAGAGLDVVTPEPLPEDNPLWAMRNVIITSHTSGNSPQARNNMVELTIQQLRHYLAGEPLINVVDVQAGY